MGYLFERVCSQTGYDADRTVANLLDLFRPRMMK
jgi:hypothetical protein